MVSTQKAGDKKQKWWSNEDMENAMHNVIDKSMSLLRAANKHGVPKSTLHDRISGKVKHGDKPGPKLLLITAEENEFAQFLVEMSQASYGQTSSRQQQRFYNCTSSKENGDKLRYIIWFNMFQMPAHKTKDCCEDLRS